MSSIYKHLATFAASAALLITPVAAVGSAPASQTALPADGWLALSMLTPSGVAVLGESGAAAAQGESGAAAAQPEAPPLPPPPESAGIGVPPIPVIAVLAAVIAVDIYIATKSHQHHRIPNSPV